MKTKAQIRATKRFKKKNPSYFAEKQREYRKKWKLEKEQQEDNIKDISKEN